MEEDEKILADRFMLLFKEAGKIKNSNPASIDAQNLVKRKQDYITENCIRLQIIGTITIFLTTG